MKERIEKPIVDGEYREAPLLIGWVECIKCRTWLNPKKYSACPTCGGKIFKR